MASKLTQVQRQALDDVVAGTPYGGSRSMGDVSRRHRVLLRLIARKLLTSKDSVSLELTKEGHKARGETR